MYELGPSRPEKVDQENGHTGIGLKLFHSMTKMRHYSCLGAISVQL